MSSLLKDVNDQAGDISNMDLHNQLADVLDRNREVSIQEGIYRTLSLPMTKSTVKIKFLSTVHPHLRDGLLKGGIKKLKDGEIIFHLSPHQYYQNRPVECIKRVYYELQEQEENYWDELSFAEFWRPSHPILCLSR